MLELTLEKVGPENLKACGIGCITNRSHPGVLCKLNWLQKRFAEGLRFFLFRNKKGKAFA